MLKCFIAFKVSSARQSQGEGTAGKLAQQYIPENRLAGRAHQCVAEGLGIHMVQILYGPAPRFSFVQEAVLPILQPLKIQPAPHTDIQTSQHRGTRVQMRGTGEVRLVRQLGREPAVITRTVNKLHNKAQHT